MQLKYLLNQERLIPAGVFKKYPEGVIIKKGMVVDLTDGELKSVKKWYTAGQVAFEELRTARTRNVETIKTDEEI